MKRWKPWLIAAVVAAVGCCVFTALSRVGLEVRERVTDARLDCLAGAVGLCILYRLVNSTGWVFVLRSLGHPMPLAQGARIWITAETMRWLPGSVWGFVSRVFQAEKAGASPAVAAASLPLELLLTIAAWAITAGVALCCSGLLSVQIPWWAVAAALAVALCGLRQLAAAVRRPQFAAGGGDIPPQQAATSAPPQQAAAVHSKLAALRQQFRALSQLRPRVGPLAFTLVLYTGLCALNGLAFFCVLRALTDAPISLAAAIGANACGWLAGFFAVGVPGGIGVREASSAAVLAAVVPVETVVAAALLWRVVLIADELCCLGILLAVECRQPAAGGAEPTKASPTPSRAQQAAPSAKRQQAAGTPRRLPRPRPASALVADLRGPQP